ncbi:MAG: retroviral-like aspartic protease family protein [Candidatus Symbiothrix sp.]|jgi:clan AA aspartic protease (TIGR02281 family)|nr:retroviral-like aspartic protease family protein [Candidatus Symbiothrix sp.]
MTYQFSFNKRKIIVTPLIKGRVEPVYFNFIVDTGAATTVIDKSVATMMDFDVYSNQESLITAGGRVKAKSTKIPKIELFGKEIYNFEVSVIEFPIQFTIYADGLIGMDFLQKLKRMNIDFEEQTIEV